MTKPQTEIERLRTELESAFRNRGDLYRLMLDALEAELGADRAETVLTDVVEARGREVAAAAFSGFGPCDAVAVGQAFLAASPDCGRMYPADVEQAEDRIAFQVRRCPLKDAWRDAGLPEKRIAQLCRIAGGFDRGLFEAVGLTFQNRTWSPGASDGCCWIELSNGT